MASDDTFMNQTMNTQSIHDSHGPLLADALGGALGGGSLSNAALAEAALADALPLRVAGGLHALYLSGDEPALGAIYRGEKADDAALTLPIWPPLPKSWAPCSVMFSGGLPSRKNRVSHNWAVFCALV
ncbi:MAG: DUF2332 family protein, partial [Gammaproteobacteria bacterium]